LTGIIKARRVLVTGRRGFIGSHLVDDLIGRGAEVTALDDFDGLSQEPGERRGRMAFVKMDLAKDDLRPLLAKQQFAYVFHVAGHACFRFGGASRLDFDCNALATVNLLEAVRDASPHSVILHTCRRLLRSGGDTLLRRTPRKHGLSVRRQQAGFGALRGGLCPAVRVSRRRLRLFPLMAAPPEAGGLRFPL